MSFHERHILFDENEEDDHIEQDDLGLDEEDSSWQAVSKRKKTGRKQYLSSSPLKPNNMPNPNFSSSPHSATLANNNNFSVNSSNPSHNPILSSSPPFRSSNSQNKRGVDVVADSDAKNASQPTFHLLEHAYTFWYLQKEEKQENAEVQDYMQRMKNIGTIQTVEQFWGFYSHLLRPEKLEAGSDYLVFRKGVQPMWEDENNKKGGRWMIRVKKEFSTRLWEDLLLALVGNQFESAGHEEVNGIVISIREHHDIIALWNKTASNRIVRDRIKDTLKHVLRLPNKTIMEYREHETGASGGSNNISTTAGGYPISATTPSTTYTGGFSKSRDSGNVEGAPVATEEEEEDSKEETTEQLL